uniref:Aminotransferase-like plant mobile domain-containing protein n=1 Tax=Fagus sylvatica TaxID=28930 RepID=A0A2N9FDV4_FAGSY
MHPGSQINSLRVGKNPCAKAVFREEKRVRFSARFPYFLSVFARTVDLAPDVGFRRSWYRWKACATLSLKVLDLRETEPGLEQYGSTNRGRQSVFGPPEGIFSIEIPAGPEKILTIREFHAVSEHVLFLMHLGSRITFQRDRKESLRERDILPMSDFSDLGVAGKLALPSLLRSWVRTKASLGSRDVVLRTEAIGMGWSAKSNFWFGQRLGQTWLNLVKLGQSWSNLPKLWEMCFGPRLEVLLMRWAPVGSTRLGPGYLVSHVNTRENLGGIPGVKKDQTGYEKGCAWHEVALRLKRETCAASPRAHFAPTTSFAHISRSGTPIDNPSSSTRHTILRLTIRLRLRVIQMSGQGSGSGGQRRSDRLAKGKAVAYAPESSPDTDDEYDAIEGPRTRADSVIARNLQEHFDAEATGIAAREVRPPLGPGITIGASARSSGASRRSSRTPTGAPPTRPLSKRQRADRVPPSANPIPEDFIMPGFRYPPQGGIRPRYHVTTLVVDTPLMTNLINHPSSLVRRCEDPSIESTGRGGWSDFCKLLGDARQEYREFLTELGFGPFLSIPYVYVSHPLVRCWVERFFHHTGTFHLSTCEMGVLPVDWSAILGIRFGAIEGTRSTSLRLRYLRDLLRREKDEPSTELRYRQWTAYFIFSYFLSNDKSTAPTPIVGMLWDVDTLRELPSAPDPAFPLTRRWGSAWIRRLTSCTLLECRTTVDCIRDIDVAFQPYSSALLGGEAIVPVDPPSLMTIESYIPEAPSDSYVEGVDSYPDLVRAEVPYQEWFTQNSLGPLMSVHEVEGGRVMGGVGRSGCGDGPATGGDGPVAGGVGPTVEGGGLSGCGAGCSGCKHSESRGSALELGYCPCY